MNEFEDLVEEREETYGNFQANAEAVQNVMRTLRRVYQNNEHSMHPAGLEGIEMCIRKIVRLLNGQTDHYDSWTDAINYLMLARSYSARYPEKGSTDE